MKAPVLSEPDRSRDTTTKHHLAVQANPARLCEQKQQARPAFVAAGFLLEDTLMTRNTNITLTIDQDGAEIALIPLRRRAAPCGHATISRVDLAELTRDGVSLNWYLKVARGNGYVCAYDAAHLGGNQTIARRLLGAGRYEAVSYRDGDRTNLRRENLYLGRSPAASGPTLKAGSILVETSEGASDHG